MLPWEQKLAFRAWQSALATRLQQWVYNTEYCAKFSKDKGIQKKDSITFPTLAVNCPSKGGDTHLKSMNYQDHDKAQGCALSQSWSRSRNFSFARVLKIKQLSLNLVRNPVPTVSWVTFLGYSRSCLKSDLFPSNSHPWINFLSLS